MTLPLPDAQKRPSRTPRRLVGGLFIAAIVLVGGWYYWKARVASERRNAIEDATTADFSQVEPTLLRCYQRNPSDLEVVQALAQGYFKADDLRGEPYFDAWVALRPGASEPLRLRMEYYRKRRDEKALDNARQLLALDPSNAQLRRSVVSQAFSYGSFEEAETLCREVLTKQPADVFSRKILAECRRARGDAIESATIFDQLIAESPTDSSPLMGRATLYQEAGEWQKSIPLVRKVFEQNPQQRRAAGYMLSLALDKTGQPEDAQKVMSEVRRLQDVEVFSDAIKNQPQNLELQTRLGLSLLQDGHQQDGLALLNSVLERDPWFRPVHKALADYYAKIGVQDRAAEHRRLAGP